MGDIKNYSPVETETLDSRKMAEMIGKQHKHLLRDVNGYIGSIKQGTEPKIGLSAAELRIEPNEFFVPGTYIDSTGRKLPCFFVTKKRCEFITNRLTGEEETKFTAPYVTRFNIIGECEKAAIGKKTVKSGKAPEKLAAADKRATAMLLNARNRAASFLQELYDRAGTKPEYQAMAPSDFYSGDGIRLSHMAFQDMKYTYDKSAIAEKLDVYSRAPGGKVPHTQAIGAIISTLDISEDERERLPYCNSGYDGVDYQYTESVVEKMRTWIETRGRPNTITVNGKNYAVVYRERS